MDDAVFSSGSKAEGTAPKVPRQAHTEREGQLREKTQ